MDCGNDLRAVSRQSSVLVIVLEINRELVHAESFEFFNTAHLLRWRTDDAETVNDLIGDEIGVVITRLAVMVVVVPFALFDVVGERLRHTTSGFTVALYDVGDVVTYHAAEPTQLVAGMSQFPW